MITVRRGQAADAAELAELAAATFRDAFAAENAPEDLAPHLAQSYGVAQQKAELADPGILTLVAFDGEEMAGYAQICRSKPPPCVATGGAMELWRFYVSQSWHGRGVAQALYCKAGFADVGSKVFVVGTDAQTDRVMLKVL